MLFSFQLFYSSITSINSTLVLCISVYTILINYIFGHPTYWRQSVSIYDIVNHNMKSIHKSSRCFSILDHLSSYPKVNNCLILLEELNDDMIIRIFEYLNPYELIIIMKTSKKYFNIICNSKKIWCELLHNTLQQLVNKISILSDEFDIRYFTDILSHSNLNSYFNKHIKCNNLIKDYFQIMNKYLDEIIKQLLYNNHIIIIIHNNIYDLTKFMIDHPGGDAIIKQYNNKDATIIFNKASHSNYALELAKNMLIFPKEYHHKKY